MMKPTSYPYPKYTHITSANPFYAVFKSGQWRTDKQLNEELHLFEKGDTPYRRVLNDIASGILNNKIEYYIVTRTFEGDTKPTKYKLYEIPIPFANIKILNIITLLKIFVKNGPKLHGMAYTDPDAKNSDLVRFRGSKIDYLSIVMTLPEKPELQDVLGVLAHELKHALLIIKNTKLAGPIAKDNDKVQALEELSSLNSEFNHILNNPTPFNCDIRTVISRLSYLQYFCQQTEVESHLESATYEIQKIINPPVNLDKRIVLNFIKDWTLDSSPENKVLEILPTLENYRVVNRICDTFDDPMSWFIICQKYPDIFDKIAELLFNKDGDPMAYIDFCKKQARQFLKKLADIVLSL